METQSAGGVVISPNKAILLVNQKSNSWSLPKGHIEVNESAIDAAKREIYEESGVSDLTLIMALGTYSRYKIAKSGGEDLSEMKHITLFLFKTNQMDLNPIDKDHPMAKWCSISEAISLLTHPKDKAFLAEKSALIQPFL